MVLTSSSADCRFASCRHEPSLRRLLTLTPRMNEQLTLLLESQLCCNTCGMEQQQPTGSPSGFCEVCKTSKANIPALQPRLLEDWDNAGPFLLQFEWPQRA